MPESILYITFKDTITNDNPDSKKLAIDNIVNQLVTASEHIRANPSSVYSYLRQDSVIVNNDIEVEEIPVINPIITEEEILEIIFKDIRRTDKSIRIIKYLIQNSGREVNVEQLLAGASLNKNDLSSWMSITGAKISCITRPSRGCYLFDPDKLIKQ